MQKRVSLSRSVQVAGFLFALIMLVGAQAWAQHFTRTDLTADTASTSMTATQFDPHLINAWGLSRSSGSPWWVSDNGTGLSTLYNAAGVPQSLVVTIPAPNANGGTSTPTGTVFNYTTGFAVAPGKPAVFLFVTEDGTIAGWNPGVNATTAVLVPLPPKKAVYKGCAIAQTSNGAYFYATNFLTGQVDVFDSSFQPVWLERWAFRDPRIPESYAPFNIQNVGGNLVVTFAKRQRGSTDEQHGSGLGFVSIFDPRGRLLQRLERGPWLNAPWGVALAPGDFGVFGHRLLIGNFGDGTIQAFNELSGQHEGTLLDANSQPLMVDGLWALSFGNNANAGSSLELYFTAGPNDEQNGLLGKIVPIPTERRGNTE